MDEKQAITRKASETEAKELVEGNDAWTAAIAGIVGGWLVLVGSVANAIKVHETHDWPWEKMIGNPREWLFYGGIFAVAIGYPIMRFTRKTTKEEEAAKKVQKENGNGE